MARKSFIQLSADLLVDFPDNITGLITPAIVRAYFQKVFDAIRPAYGLLSRTTPNAQTLQLTDAPVVFETGYVSDVPDYTTTPATGVLQRLEAGTTTINLNCSVEGTAGRIVTITLYKNGVATPWKGSATLGGVGKPVEIAFTALNYEGGAAQYQLQVKCDTAGTSVTFSGMDALAQTVPVNTY
jgi:hypothetical protein